MDVSTIDERVRQIIRRFLRELPAASDRKIARIVGCAPKVVSQVRRNSWIVENFTGMKWIMHINATTEEVG